MENKEWQKQLDEVMKQIQERNRKPFSYNIEGDALYQQYKNHYNKQAELAMKDAIGQASALTGGYGNSYAQSAGNQAYQAQMNNLNDIIPDLYQVAYDKYNKETDDLYNQYSLLTKLMTNANNVVDDEGDPPSEVDPNSSAITNFKNSLSPKQYHDQVARATYGPYTAYVALQLAKNTELSEDERVYLWTLYGITDSDLNYLIEKGRITESQANEIREKGHIT